MKNFLRILAVAIVASLASSGALAQSTPNLIFGQVPTAGQWNSYFAAKQDALGYTPLNSAGGVMTGQLITTASTVSLAGLNIQPGVAPTTPQNGDVWTTAAGVFIRINGVTIGPLASSFSTVQTIIDLNSAPLQSPQTGTILQMGQANGVIARAELDSYAATGVFTCVRANGTAASPTAIQSGDELCSLNAWGYNGAAFVGGAARMSMFAAQTWSVGAQGSRSVFSTTLNGTNTLVDRLSIENDGGILIPPTVTGGTKGIGTINVSGSYYVSGNNIFPVTVANGGTGCSAASGTCLDNITSFASTGFLERTGAGTYVFVADPLPLTKGGTGQTTALAARTSSGLNIDSCTSTGDANYTILATDRCVYHTALSAARTDTLPAANSVNAGQIFYLTDFRGVVSAINTITLQRSGADTINGVTSITAVNAQFGASIYWSDGVSRWTFFPAGTGGGGGVSSLNGQSGALTLWSPPMGRLTLASGVPVMTSTVSGATTVLYTPYFGSLVPLYNGTNIVPTVFSEVSQLTTDTTKSPAAVAASSCYDEFAWSDSGTFRVTRGPVWTNTSVRSAGSVLVVVNGLKLNSVSITNGPAAQRGTWVGTICSNASATIDMSFGGSASGGIAGSFGVWNAYNRVLGTMVSIDSGAQYAYSVATVRQARGSTGNQNSYTVGAAEDARDTYYISRVDTPAVATAFCIVGIAVDSTTAITGQRGFSQTVANTISIQTPGLRILSYPSLGFHTDVAVEQAPQAGCNFDGDSTSTLTTAVWN